MKRFSRFLILLNVCLCLLIVALLAYHAVYNQHEGANAQLVQDVYKNANADMPVSLRLGANPNVYFDPATNQAIPEPDALHRLLARVGVGQQANTPTRAPVLSLAITYGRKEWVENLLDFRADVNAPDDKGSAPLQYAALHNERDILIALLDHHADVNHRNAEGDTALHIAAAQRNAVNMQLLIDHGADPNLADGEQQTPLDVVARQCEDLHREWMLRYGESKFGEKKPGDPKNLPQIVTRSYQRRLEALRSLVEMLKKAGAKVTPPMQARLDSSFDLNPQDVEQALNAPDTAAKNPKAAH